MSGRKSKDKGSRFERELAKQFQEWSGLELRRTPLSGGWAKQNPNASGDITCIDPDALFPFHIEAKNNESWNWEAILRGTCQVFEDWWDQTISTCPATKVPLLVFSKNYHSTWVVFWREMLPFINIPSFSSYAILEGRMICLLAEFLSNHPFEYCVKELSSRQTT